MRTIETIVQDIRYAARGLARTKSFTLGAVLAIMIGIGSTTAVFTAVDRTLFRSLPYPDDDRLVSIGMMAPLDTNEFVLSADWPDWRSANSVFESMTTFTPGNDVCDLTDSAPVRLQCVRVESTFLHTFGISPLLGRDFSSEEDKPNGPKAGIISYPLWKTQFGGIRDIVGRNIVLNGVTTSVVGVLPPDFEMPNLGRADILIPQALPFVAHPNSGGPLRAFARLKPRVTLAQAKEATRPVLKKG